MRYSVERGRTYSEVTTGFLTDGRRGVGAFLAAGLKGADKYEVIDGTRERRTSGQPWALVPSLLQQIWTKDV